MKQKVMTQNVKTLNTPALISLLLIPLLAIGLLVVLLNRMYQFIPLRDLNISSIFLFLVIALVLGMGMLITGIIALRRNAMKKGFYKGTWMGIVGTVFGIVCVIGPLLVLIGFLTAVN